MNIYSSFLVRVWSQKQAAGEVAFLRVEHIQSGAEFHSNDLNNVWQWMLETSHRLHELRLAEAVPDPESE